MGATAQAPTRSAVARRLRRHRRPLSAVLLATAAGTVVHAALPQPAGTSLVTVAHDLPAGHVLSGADLTTTAVPAGAVPDGALGAEGLEGARLASAVRAGEPVTDARVSGAGLVVALPTGQVAVPVLLAPQVRPWLTVGQRVRLHPVPAGTGWAQGAAGTAEVGTAEVGTAEVVVEDAVVLDIAAAPSDGLLAGGATTGLEGVTVLVQVPDHDAARLAAASGPVPAVLLGSS